MNILATIVTLCNCHVAVLLLFLISLSLFCSVLVKNLIGTESMCESVLTERRLWITDSACPSFISILVNMVSLNT